MIFGLNLPLTGHPHWDDWAPILGHWAPKWVPSLYVKMPWAKRCKIGPRLRLITDRKSHIGFQMT